MVTKAGKKLIAILCILVLIFPISIGVLAKITNPTKSTTKNFGIEMLHTSYTLDKKKQKQFGYATDTSTKPTYRIYEGEENNKNYDTTILCLDQSKRYPREKGTTTNNATYTSLGEATEDTLKEAMSGLTEEQSKKILWLVRNAVAPEDSEAMKDLKLAKILESELNGTETNRLTLADVKSVLTEDDLVFAMQFAIWEVTNGISIKAPQGTEDGTNWAGLAGSKFGNKGKLIIKIIEFYAKELQKSQLSDIIDSHSGEEANLTISNGTEEEGKAGVKQEGGYVYLGPFKISGSEGNDYTVKISLLTDSNQDANTNFFIREQANDKSKKLSCTKKDLDNKDFYIQIRNNTKATKVKIELETGISIQTAKGYVWKRETQDQPLISLERKENEGTKKDAEFTFTITHEKQYDVALRKYISSIKRKNGNSYQLIWQETENGNSRKPIRSEKQSEGAFNQYEYKHKKDPLQVKVGDRITYTIQVTNEEKANIKVTKVKDYLPPKGLTFVQDDDASKSMNWTYDETHKTATTSYFENFSPSTELDSRWVKIVCEVTSDGVGKVLTNIAEIEEFKDTNNGQTITQDLDSGPGNIQLPTTEEEWENYKGNEDNKDDLSDPNYYYKGQQDDDDFDKVIVKADETQYNVQIKKVDKNNPSKGLQGADFLVTLPNKTTETITTQPGGIASTSYITIKDTENESITFKETKAPEGYKIVDETFTLDVEKELKDGKYVLKSVKLRETSSCASLDVNIDQKKIVITVQNKQDAFDLRLRKFITQVGDTQVTDRTPKVKLNNNVLEYEHTKDPKLVKKGQKVVYTIRVYNEGVEDGYAAEIKDDLPDGIKFLKDDEINKKYDWKMYKANGEITENVEEAETIKTDYLSKAKSDARKEQPLKAFDPAKTVDDKTNPDHRDVEVAFEVTMDVTTEEKKVIINTAEISKDEDADGKDVTDIDSEPDNGADNEDDIDKEYIELEVEDSEYKLQIEKVDEKDPSKKLKNAKFSVKLPDGKTEEITTDDKGIATTQAIKITDKNNDTIEIKETQAPEEYKLIEETLKIEVTKDIEQSHYVVKDAQLKEGSDIAEISLDQGQRIVKITIKNKRDAFDLRLRKFITKIDENNIDDRIPTVTSEDGKLKYDHSKEPKLVKNGQKVEYTIRVYNEGKIAGYASEIKDDIPEGLTFLPTDSTNQTYGWKMYKEDGTETTEVKEAKTIKTNYLAKDESGNNLLKAFDQTKNVDDTNPAHKEVKVVFQVTKEITPEDQNRKIINTAEISNDQDENGEEIDDVDSTPNNDDEKEDDLDKEYLELETEESVYNLKIEKVDENDENTKLKDAEFTVTLADNRAEIISTGEDGIAEISTIKVTNEGTEIISIKETKAPAGYRLIDETFEIELTKEVSNGSYVITKAELKNNSDIATLSKEDNTLKIKIKNKRNAFDLRLRKFISEVEGTTKDREPKVTNENGVLKYEHSKVPVTVKKGQKVVYTIRVYNEGIADGYASEIKDDIPEGLTFLPNDPTNQTYGWKMYDSEGHQTTNPSDAVTIRTDYLSKEKSEKNNLLKAFDSSAEVSNTNPDHRDVKVAFQVTAKASAEGQIIVNTAEISDDQNENGESVDDVDSTPNNDDEKEDDLDKEYIELEIEESEYNLKIEKVDEDNEDLKLKNAEFAVTLSSEETKTVTTGEDGIAEIPTIKVTNTETEIISIKETKAPAGYRLIDETFEIELTKGISEGSYVITKAELKNNSDIATLSTENNTLKIKIKNKRNAFDLRLRKFITEVEGEARDRAPKVTYENDELKYEHSKVPVTVKKGQKVIYTIRVYNEGVADGYAAEIKDDIPEGLTFLPSDETNVKYGWKMYDGNGQETQNVSDAVTIRTDYLSKEKSEERKEDNLLKAFDSSAEINNKNPDNREVKVAFQVSENASTDVQIVNTAEISKNEDVNGNDIEDDDSEPDNNDPNEDDIDKEYLKVEIEESEFKLKIEKVDESDPNKKLADAEFTVTLSDGKTQNVITGSDGIGELPTIKVTNTDTETIKIKETKAPKGYELISETFEIELTKDVINGYYVVTNATLTNDSDTATLSTEENTLKITIKNKPSKFDLALRKYITQLGGKEISDREPKVTYENGEIKYNHSKDPLTVIQGQKIIYTIRVYNEGNQDGYAAEITDDIPEGLTFLPDDTTNKTYGWKMYDSSGNETKDVKKAVSIKTDYLSKEKSESNLLRAFNSEAEISDTNPDHKDVKVAFEVNTDSMSSRNKTIINTAEITKDEDKSGNDVDDIDSTPGNNEPDEDDIDKEYVEPKCFDLSLLKYVSKVIVTEDGVTKETKTGYDGTENPEPIVKVELNRKKLDKTEVKYVFTIKITNEGEIEGYATEITDRIPEGLEFHEEDNKQYGWKIKEKGIVTTDYLKNKLLQPGESATVQIVLRWINSDKNLKQKVNVAEITADDNPYDAPDIDSTPNNNKDGEDDQDNAAVILSISTGKAGTYITLILGIAIFIGVGGFVITKYIIIE